MARRHPNLRDDGTRNADAIVEASEKRMGTLALISRTQVKLWKMMLFTVFLAGFVGALAFVVGKRSEVRASGADCSILPVLIQQCARKE